LFSCSHADFLNYGFDKYLARVSFHDFVSDTKAQKHKKPEPEPEVEVEVEIDRK